MGYGLHHLVYIVTSKTRIHVSRGPIPSRIIYSSSNIIRSLDNIPLLRLNPSKI
jgi:hypothetical protein